MKHQALFSLKDGSKKIKESSAAILFGTLRVKKNYACPGQTVHVFDWYEYVLFELLRINGYSFTFRGNNSIFISASFFNGCQLFEKKNLFLQE